MGEGLDRRSFLRNAVATSLLPSFASAQVNVPKQQAAPAVAKNTLAPAFKASLDAGIAHYMAAMNAPGMQFALTNLRGVEYVASYGLENLETGKTLTRGRLFQIGSISKSMGVLCILQLVDEGRLDMQKPVMEYLPWLAWETPFGAVTLHHVMTHTAGLPESGALIYPANRWVHRQRYPPGRRYYYSNLAFNVLGQLVSQADKRPYAESLRERIFQPLGMTTARGQLGGSEWLQQSVSYIPAAPDVPFKRFDPLREAPAFHEETSAGCVAATPADMAAYLRCLLRGGVADSGKRIVSEQSFVAMTTRHVDADEWGKGWGYGYGLGTNTVDGDHQLVHTGGMVSFMSSIFLDLTKGVAAFASINAQQGYRPTPAARWAVEALAASHTGKALPASISIPSERAAKPQLSASPLTAAQQAFVGSYVNDDPWAGSLEVIAGPNGLLLSGTPLVPVGDGSFWVEDEPGAPDRCAFSCVVDGAAHVLTVNGTEFRRFRRA